VDWEEQLDPELKDSMSSGPTLGSLQLEDLPSLYEVRRSVKAPDLSPSVEREDHVIDSATGVSVRVHRPKGVARLRGCLLTIHGGSFIVGSNRMDDQLLDQWCPALGIVGISVDYRLAPESPYPAALEDCVRALLWIREKAPSLGADPHKLGVYGLSAGGCLAAGLVLRCREMDVAPPPSNRWNVPVAVELGWRAYLGDLYGTDGIPPTAAPARSTDLGGLPPACITIGALDGLVDESNDFTGRLHDAGAECQLHVYEGAPHLFAVQHPNTAVAKRCRSDQLAWLKEQLARPSSG
jgi:acetyl esterase/lipase